MNEHLQETQQEMLFEAILRLKTADELRQFMADLCSITELNSLGQRYHVASMLYGKQVYQDIAEATSASTATISRVNRSLQYGAGGFRIALERQE